MSQPTAQMQTAFDFISNQVSPNTKVQVLDSKQRDQLARIDQQLESIDTTNKEEGQSSLAVPNSEEDGGDDYEPLPAAGIRESNHNNKSAQKKKIINPLYAEDSDSDEYYDEEDDSEQINIMPTARKAEQHPIKEVAEEDEEERHSRLKLLQSQTSNNLENSLSIKKRKKKRVKQQPEGGDSSQLLEGMYSQEQFENFQSSPSPNLKRKKKENIQPDIHDVDNDYYPKQQRELSQDYYPQQQQRPYLDSKDFTVDDEDIYKRKNQNHQQPLFHKDSVTSVGNSLFKDKSYLNVAADDSASQVHNRSSHNNQISNMRNNPFTSNLENAKLLAQLTKERVNALNLGQEMASKLQNEDLDPSRMQQIFLEFSKTNKYLSSSLRNLNVTIDVLLEQYNPIKFKYKEQSKQARQGKEREDMLLIQRKVEEIKNAEKQLKIVEKECMYLEKKEQRMKNKEYCRGLGKQIRDGEKTIEEIKRDIYNLKKEQKRTERLIAKKEQYLIAHPDQAGQAAPEIQELDNEISMLSHKFDQLKDKDTFLTQEDARQRDQFQKLRVQEYKMANKELKMIDMGKKLYGIDFSDHQQIMQEAENEERKQEKQQLLKKIAIIQQSMEINKRNYQNHMKNILKRRKDQEVHKQAVEETLNRLDDDIKQAQDEHRQRKENRKNEMAIMLQQQEANEALRKQRHREVMEQIEQEDLDIKIDEKIKKKKGSISTRKRSPLALAPIQQSVTPHPQIISPLNHDPIIHREEKQTIDSRDLQEEEKDIVKTIDNQLEMIGVNNINQEQIKPSGQMEEEEEGDIKIEGIVSKTRQRNLQRSAAETQKISILGGKNVSPRSNLQGLGSIMVSPRSVAQQSQGTQQHKSQRNQIKDKTISEKPQSLHQKIDLQSTQSRANKEQSQLSKQKEEAIYNISAKNKPKHSVISEDKTMNNIESNGDFSDYRGINVESMAKLPPATIEEVDNNEDQ